MRLSACVAWASPHAYAPCDGAFPCVEGPAGLGRAVRLLKFYGRTAIDPRFQRLCPRRGRGGPHSPAPMGDMPIRLSMRTTAFMVIRPLDCRGWDVFVFISSAPCEVQVLAMTARSQADPGRTQYRSAKPTTDAWRRFGERPTASGERQAQSDARGAGIRGLNRAQGTQFMQASMKVASKPPSPAGRDRGW